MRAISILVICMTLGPSQNNSVSINPEWTRPSKLTPSHLVFLYSDKEVEDLLKEKNIKDTNEGFVLFRVNANKSVQRSQVFKDLSVNEKKLHFLGGGLFQYALIFDWRISRTYTLSCSTSVLSEISGNRNFSFTDLGVPPAPDFKICEVKFYMQKQSK